MGFKLLLLTLFIAASYCLGDVAASCILPPYPEHGSYTTTGELNAEPGQTFDNVHLTASCNSGYIILGPSSVFCVNGAWSSDLPKCVRACLLHKHPSVTYYCTVNNNVEGLRECSEKEPVGTVVVPKCNVPNYYFPGVLNSMKCIDGSWDYVAVCQAECGRVTPQGEMLVLDGRPTRGEMPWHAAIYRKTTKPYMQICGGSIVSSTVIISAAHCFWGDVELLKPASDYAVAVGKQYRPWDFPQDSSAQKSDVKEIKIPTRFRGNAANYQDDISLVLLKSPIEFKVHVRPVCLDFDLNFDFNQLENGKRGKLAGWNVQDVKNAGHELKVIEVTNLDIATCIGKMPSSFREYITSDKICGEFLHDKFGCRGNSGAGSAFPMSERGVVRYYLRGVLSTGPIEPNGTCDLTLATFTHVLKHESFIKGHL